MANILSITGANAQCLVRELEVLWQSKDAELRSAQNDLRKTKARLKLKDSEIRELKGRVAKLNKMLFGAKADHKPKIKTVSPEQPGTAQSSSLSTQVVQSTKQEPSIALSDKGKRKGRGKKVFPPHLERREIYEGTSDRQCPCGCGGSIRGFDIVETLKVIPASFYVAVHQYPKYRCRAKDKIVGTSHAPRIFPNTSMDNGLLAHVVYLRFGAQLPWYRQEALFQSSGIELNRSTLMKWSNRTATEALYPIYELLASELRTNSARLFMDETTIPMLSPGNGKTCTNYLFALHRDDRSFGGNKPAVVLYCPSKTRAMYKIHEILAGVSAIVQTDAYAGYGQLGRQGTSVEGITPTKCWAHARRQFTDDFEINKTVDARTVVEMIAELYAEEAKIRGKPPVVREAHRLRHSEPILDRLYIFLNECSVRHLPKSGMAKAIRYVQKHWAELTVFIENGRVDLDTNPVERMFKPAILLRKNALFMGSDEGAEAWGIWSSIVETCKLNKVNVEPYLKWVLDEISGKLPRSDYQKLLPWNAPHEFRLER